MIRINLLPDDLEVQQTPINPVLPLAACGILPLLVIIPLHLKLQATQKELQADITQKRQDLDKLQSIIKQVQELENARTQLNNRKNIIKQLEDERLRYPQFMDDFVKLLPGNLWLTNLTTLQQPAGNTMTLTMEVIALDNYAIADLISNFETSQVFTDVDLGQITASGNTQTGAQSMAFRVSATYKRMEPISDASKKS